MNKKLIGLILCLFLYSIIFGQNITGEWYGVGVVKRSEVNNDYLSELILRQKGRIVTGEFNYFLGRVEVTSKIVGTFDASTRLLRLKVQPILNFKARDLNGADCPMEGIFILQVSRVETSLKGQFRPVNEYRLTCPPINIRFIKETETPEEKEPAPTAAADTIKALTEPITAVKGDTIKTEPEVTRLLTELNTRTFEASPVIEVDSDSLKLTLYDNGEVDGDTISLFYNRQLIAAHQLLSGRAFNITVPIDTTVHEISMLAENLGTIPPNTALCVIYAGEQRFELSMSSSFIKNATLRFRRKKK